MPQLGSTAFIRCPSKVNRRSDTRSDISSVGLEGQEALTTRPHFPYLGSWYTFVNKYSISRYRVNLRSREVFLTIVLVRNGLKGNFLRNAYELRAVMISPNLMVDLVIMALSAHPIFRTPHRRRAPPAILSSCSRWRLRDKSRNSRGRARAPCPTWSW